MQAGAAVADLRAGDQRRTFAEAGGRGRAAGALRDVLVDLAVLVGPGAEALDRGDDHARVELVDVVPGQPHAVERAGREVLHQHVALLDQRIEHTHALRVLGVDGDRALVVVEHGEIEAVGVRHVAQLAARDVADARTLDLDHVGAEPGEQLRAGRPRLHVGEVENAHAGERLAGLAVGLAARLRQTVADSPSWAPPASPPCGRIFSPRFSPWISFVSSWPLSSPPTIRLVPSVAATAQRPRSRVRGYFLRILHALRIEVADAAALAAGRRVEHRVDQRRLAGSPSPR